MMALDSQGFFLHLKAYLNTDYYSILTNLKNELILVEKIFTPDGKKTIRVKFDVEGEAFAFKLDTEVSLKDGKKPTNGQASLFHFLDNEGKPWSKRCDFVIFHLHRNRVKIYCLEFKYKSLPVDSIVSQLKSSADWVQSLCSIIKIYSGKRKRMNLTKYVLSYCDDPSRYLDAENKYLTREPSIRHYKYDEVDGMKLHELENIAVESIG